MRKIIMKKLFLASMAFLCVWIWNAGAQTMAPNYFHANPQQFKQRIAKVKNFSSCFFYEYAVNNRLKKIRSENQTGQTIQERVFSYNDAGYMIREEEYVGLDLTLLGKYEYERNDMGYITHFKRHMPNENLELVEDIRIDFFYDTDMKLIKAEIDAFNHMSNEWYDLRTTNLVYNEKGLLKEVIQIDTESGEELNREILTYNNVNKIVSIRFKPGHAGIGEEKEWIFEYDNENLDIIKAGREDFWRYYQYDKEKLASETFFPKSSLVYLVYFGPKDYMDFSGLPSMNSYTHAVIKETENEMEVTYESNAAYSLTIIQPENGEIKLTADGESLSSGSMLVGGHTITVHPTPADGYEVDKVLVNGQSIEKPYQFVIEKNTEVTALMKKSNAADEIAAQDFRIYPVPTSKDLTIEIPLEMVGKVASLIDMNGRIVYRITLDNIFQQIDISHLKGVFLLQIGDITERVIVQ